MRRARPASPCFTGRSGEARGADSWQPVDIATWTGLRWPSQAAIHTATPPAYAILPPRPRFAAFLRKTWDYWRLQQAVRESALGNRGGERPARRLTAARTGAADSHAPRAPPAPGQRGRPVAVATMMSGGFGSTTLPGQWLPSDGVRRVRRRRVDIGPPCPRALLLGDVPRDAVLPEGVGVPGAPGIHRWASAAATTTAPAGPRQSPAPSPRTSRPRRAPNRAARPPRPPPASAVSG